MLAALNEALRAADPKTALRRKVKIINSELFVDSVKLNLSKFDRVFVIGGGKAGADMALAIEEILGNRITSGVVNIPDYLRPKEKPRTVELYPATHPIPSPKGVAGVQKMLELVSKPALSDLVVCLISGGGSSLLPLPLDMMKLSDVQDVTDLLLRSGAGIQEINTVRKHLSAIKGGRLAQKLYPATVLSLIISDVVGDRLDSIASGPTVAEATRYSDAKRVLVNYHIWQSLSDRARKAIEEGISDPSKETPKPGSTIFERVFNVLVGSNKQSCIAASRHLRKMGYKTLVLSTHVQGEAKDVGKIFAGILRDLRTNGLPLSSPAAIVAGGETTVTVTGHGKGGRNQELALSAAFGIEGLANSLVASIGTDGVDGPTDAAGAFVDGHSLERAKKLGMNPSRFLETHDSYHFFKKLGDLIITGPTGTNVNDIMIVAAR